MMVGRYCRPHDGVDVINPYLEQLFELGLDVVRNCFVEGREEGFAGQLVLEVRNRLAL